MLEELERRRVVERRRVPQPFRQRLPHLRQRQAGKALVQHHRHRHERLRRHRPRQIHVHGANPPAAQGQHEQHLVAGHGNEFDLFQNRLVQPRRDRHAQLARQQPQHPRRAPDQPLQRCGAFFLLELPPQTALLGRGQPDRPHQRVDVVAVREVRRDPAGRGVRMIKEPLLFEVRHRVPDRRRGHTQRILL